MQDRTKHIHVLELQVGHLVLKHLLLYLRGRHVLVRSDNIFDRLPYQPPGWHQFCKAAAGVPGPPDVGSTPSAQPASSVSTGRPKPGGRLPLPSQASSRGATPPPRGGACNLGPLWQSRGGSLYLRDVDQLPPFGSP